MSRVIVLSDGVVDAVIKSNTPINTFLSAPKVTVMKGCGCKGKPKTPVESVDYNQLRINLINNPVDLEETKQFLKVDTLVMFVRENGVLARKTV